jgi:hypothetical protein
MIQRSVTQSLHDLFRLANNRFDSRHVIQSPVGPTFHPEMTGPERRAFHDDADTIVRGLICGYLGLPVFTVIPDPNAGL